MVAGSPIGCPPPSREAYPYACLSVGVLVGLGRSCDAVAGGRFAWLRGCSLRFACVWVPVDATTV